MRLAVYAGSFDPITRGHLSVVQHAHGLFDALWIVVAVHPKKQPLLSVQERVELICQSVAPLPGIQVVSTEGLVVELARKLGARFLVRGVRDATDVEDEIRLANLNAELAPEIRTVFVPAEPKLAEVSSSRLKELVATGQDVSSYCSAEVAQRLALRLCIPSEKHI